MSQKTLFILINIIGLIFAVILCIGNDVPLTLKFLGASLNIPAGFALLALYLIGLLVSLGSALPFISSSKEKSAEKLKDWQKQDAKLLKEVQSDKEKLLEAKIATLEVALKQALKK